MHTHMHTHMHARTLTHMHTHARTHVHTHTQTSTIYNLLRAQLVEPEEADIMHELQQHKDLMLV